RAVAPRFRELGYTAMLDGEVQAAQLTALPGVIEPARSRLWLALLLFALTVASTIFIGGANATQGLRVPDGLAAALGAQGSLFVNVGLGLAYSAALLGILLSHELGHYIVARRLGVGVSFPFFIPLPVSILGTMGAVIQIKEPPLDRPALLKIGVAGPLAGLVVAIPVLLFGLSLSEVGPIPARPYAIEGNSLLYALLKIVAFGRFLPDGSQDVLLHPVAFAGWAGLLVTGLNLLPAGQLDGGHILYALFGRRASRYASMVVAGVLVALGFVWNGWWLWAVLVVLFGQQPAPVLNEITPLDRRGRVLAILGIVAFVLVFTPVPLTEVR
ncbi:MAG: site-2 protease family protein, partial [Chloroflexales bacterium]|nr:site-2 protease family protein [Chloroflexales bacterium]